MNKHLQRAYQLAQTSKLTHGHGAVVVLRGQIVAEATNKRIAPTTQTSWRRSHIHAEHAAILAAGNKTHGATLCVARAGASGPANSRPCCRCDRIIRRAGIAHVIYT